MKIGKIVVAVLAVALLGISACSRKSEITTAYDLDGKRVGVREGTTCEAWVKANLPKATINTYRFNSDAATDLSKGVIDAIVVDEMPARTLAAEYNNLEVLDLPSFSREEYGVAVSKWNTDLLASINAAIEKIRQSGEYDRIYSSFIEPEDGIVRVPGFNTLPGTRTLRFGTNSGFAPFGYKDGDRVVGFDISLAELIARECRADLEIVDMNFHNLLSSLANGEVDFVAAAMTITEERKNTVNFSIPYFTTEQVVLVRK